MVDIFPGVNSPTYSTLFDWRPLHIYILHEKGNFHLQLRYLEFSTYQLACTSIKAHWKQLLDEEYGAIPIVLTTNAGAVVHHDNWTSFIAKRSPCLAWYGSDSMELLLDELRKKKEFLNRHLEQLCTTEAIVHWAGERLANRIGVERYPWPTMVEEGEELEGWDFLDHAVIAEYAAAVGRAEESGSVDGVFDQEEAKAVPSA